MDANLFVKNVYNKKAPISSQGALLENIKN